MAIYFLALFIATPLIEIYFLIEVGSVIGALPTIIVCIVTAVLGTSMLRVQGMSTLNRARQQLDQQIIPEEELVGGVFLLLAGLFLLTPGFLTDALGFLLLIPPLRRTLARWALARMTTRVNMRTHGRYHHHGNSPHGNSPHGNGNVIDGEFEDISEPDKENGDGRSLPR